MAMNQRRVHGGCTPISPADHILSTNKYLLQFQEFLQVVWRYEYAIIIEVLKNPF